jgi:hypothetical protein
LAKTLRAGGTPLHSLDAFISTADAFISTADAFSARSFPFPTPHVEGKRGLSPRRGAHTPPPPSSSSSHHRLFEYNILVYMEEQEGVILDD